MGAWQEKQQKVDTQHSVEGGRQRERTEDKVIFKLKLSLPAAHANMARSTEAV